MLDDQVANIWNMRLFGKKDAEITANLGINPYDLQLHDEQLKANYESAQVKTRGTLSRISEEIGLNFPYTIMAGLHFNLVGRVDMVSILREKYGTLKYASPLFTIAYMRLAIHYLIKNGEVPTGVKVGKMLGLNPRTIRWRCRESGISLREIKKNLRANPDYQTTQSRESIPFDYIPDAYYPLSQGEPIRRIEDRRIKPPIRRWLRAGDSAREVVFGARRF